MAMQRSRRVENSYVRFGQPCNATSAYIFWLIYRDVHDTFLLACIAALKPEQVVLEVNSNGDH